MINNRCLIVIVSLILFFAVTTAPSSACIIDDDGLSNCILPKPAVAVPSVALAPPLPLGDSPAQARDVPNEWQALEPRASIWYKTDYSDSFRLLEYWLETNLPDVASVAVYSPDQTEGLSAATKPIGRGTRNKNDPDNVIRWKAGYAKPGVWYVYLSNNTDQPVSYKLNHNQENVQAKNCISYWETINGTLVYWTDCGRYGPPK